MSGSRLITVKIVTPSGEGCRFECDSLRLTAPDNEKGKGGGSFGVRYGHADALAAIDKGEVCAYLDGKIIRKIRTDGGLAKIGRDEVTVITEGYTEE